ncbi:MAG: hypothetical protein JWN67_2541 [Actinomycetia bacterium]|nr:hypothetical protein [Actinomycetes bacterium]
MPVIRMEPEHVIDAQVCATGAVLTIHGCLDQAAGEALVKATARLVMDQPHRLEIDLCSLTGFSAEGACALAACRDLCTSLAEGLHYKTGQGAGREALLAAYADC